MRSPDRRPAAVRPRIGGPRAAALRPEQPVHGRGRGAGELLKPLRGPPGRGGQGHAQAMLGGHRHHRRDRTALAGARAAGEHGNAVLGDRPHGRLLGRRPGPRRGRGPQRGPGPALGSGPSGPGPASGPGSRAARPARPAAAALPRPSPRPWRSGPGPAGCRPRPPPRRPAPRRPRHPVELIAGWILARIRLERQHAAFVHRGGDGGRRILDPEPGQGAARSPRRAPRYARPAPPGSAGSSPGPGRAADPAGWPGRPAASGRTSPPGPAGSGAAPAAATGPRAAGPRAVRPSMATAGPANRAGTRQAASSCAVS